MLAGILAGVIVTLAFVGIGLLVAGCVDRAR